jgi:hypothetical protein
MTRRLLLGILVTLGVVTGVTRAGAHEIGKTQVVAVFEPIGGTYQLDIAVDPDALLTRLQITATGDVAKPPDRETRDRQIPALGEAFLDSVRVRFDGEVVRPRFEYRPASAFGDFSQVPSIVRLSGVIPAGARAFTIEYELASATFALVAHVGDSAAQTFWLEGGHESGVVSLLSPPPPPTVAEVARRYFSLGYTHILPKGSITSSSSSASFC